MAKVDTKNMPVVSHNGVMLLPEW